jgi:hypothetical protein
MPPRRDEWLSSGRRLKRRWADTVFVEWLRRCAIAQYSRLVFSFLDDLRLGWHRFGAGCSRGFYGIGSSRGNTRPARRPIGDRLRRHFRTMADLAVLKYLSYE